MLASGNQNLSKFARPQKCAFTLVEILLVVSLISMIGIALYHSFSNGLKVWERGTQSFVEEDIAIFLDKISSDLKNSLWYSKIRFDGKGNRMAFATLVRVPIDAGILPSRDRYINQIGKVEYYFDGSRNVVYRRQANYSQALKNKYAPPRLLAGNLKSIRFKYYYRSGKGYTVEDSGNDIIPSGVLIEINFAQGEDQRRMARFISIPVGS